MYELDGPPTDWVTAFLQVRAPNPAIGSWFSSFSAAVRDAREATGRDLDSGDVVDELRAASWLGMLGYLVLLDLIGECFAPAEPERTPVSDVDIVRALAHFGPPELTDDEILAVYALRCSIAHNYGLVNLGTGRLANRLDHAFLLTNRPGAPLVTLPSTRWDRNLRHAQTMRTVIDVRTLGDLAETVIANVQALDTVGALDVILVDGANELMARFSMTLYADSPA